MPIPIAIAISASASRFLLIVLGFLALLVIDLIIALIEGVALTLLRWNPFRASLTVSLIMNIISGVVNGALLILLQRSPIMWLPISFLISISIESFILSYFKREALRRNVLYVVLVNLASYFLLILPAYHFGTHP